MSTPDPIARAIQPRMLPVGFMLIASYCVALAALWATSSGGLDAAGRPLGTDFSNVWSAGRLVLEGAPQAAYDVSRHYAEQVREFGAGVPFYGWHYPPMFLAVAALIATLPYLGALVVWQAATLPLYLLALAKVFGESRRELFVAGLAFPAVFVNLTHGHNGFLTAGLFGLGLAVLNRRPILAGVLFGLLAYKPQFGVLIPFALAAGGYWRTAFAAAGTVAADCLLSLAAFGPETWEAFRESAAFTRTIVLETGGTGWHKIMCAFAAVRALGGGVSMAYAAQGVVALVVLAVTVRLWRGDSSYDVKAAALLAGSALVTPYALDYDLMILAPAIAFMVRDALRTGFRRHEASLLGLVWLAPLVARPLAELTLFPLGFLSTLALFALAASRGAALPAPSRMFAHVPGR
ncbi:MAG: hypothetical protein DI565_17675 [Ancylobacter novellus]|uniref:DUF2029 domain-containing protein n=1 Tax=Ancylobacter novellus TaxID=921 RepID=A0A2W5K807_ANCNO|nr:MAG: hypothetical protein DI565_17675 [Ancylobacter novellus]